jgi:DNA-directed RNA polymerase specialized sigma24 family protein
MTARSPQQRRVTAKEGALLTGVSERQVRRLVALPRDEWLTKKADEREAILTFHDDEGHSWTQTAKHFGLHVDTVRRRARRARRARRDRAAAQAATAADTHEDPQSST